MLHRGAGCCIGVWGVVSGCGCCIGVWGVA